MQEEINQIMQKALNEVASLVGQDNGMLACAELLTNDYQISQGIFLVGTFSPTEKQVINDITDAYLETLQRFIKDNQLCTQGKN